jgi:hypothetical protein
MKTILSVPRIAVLALVLGTASATATFAQTASVTTGTTTPPTCSGGGWHRHHDSILTDAEKTELKAARDTVFAGNPSLKQQFETLKSAGKGSGNKADWKALHAQLRADELAVDGKLAPIFAKLDAAHGHHHSS